MFALQNKTYVMVVSLLRSNPLREIGITSLTVIDEITEALRSSHLR